MVARTLTVVLLPVLLAELLTELVDANRPLLSRTKVVAVATLRLVAWPLFVLFVFVLIVIPIYLGFVKTGNYPISSCVSNPVRPHSSSHNLSDSFMLEILALAAAEVLFSFTLSFLSDCVRSFLYFLDSYFSNTLKGISLKMAEPKIDTQSFSITRFLSRTTPGAILIPSRSKSFVNLYR